MKRLQYLTKSSIIALSTLVLGFASTPEALSAEEVDDPRITREVQNAIFYERTLRTSQIYVASRSGVVRLTGMVEKAPYVETAMQIAGAVPGVVGVEQALDVKD